MAAEWVDPTAKDKPDMMAMLSGLTNVHEVRVDFEAMDHIPIMQTAKPKEGEEAQTGQKQAPTKDLKPKQPPVRSTEIEYIEGPDVTHGEAGIVHDSSKK